MWEPCIWLCFILYIVLYRCVDDGGGSGGDRDMMMMMMMMMLMIQIEQQKSEAVSLCRRTAEERDEAVRGNKFLQSKLREAEIALNELGQNVMIVLLTLFPKLCPSVLDTVGWVI